MLLTLQSADIQLESEARSVPRLLVQQYGGTTKAYVLADTIAAEVRYCQLANQWELVIL